jgi:hypothetical protein
MKTIACSFCALLAAPSLAFSQSLIDSTTFFNPAFEARRPGAGGIIDVQLNNAIYRNPTPSRTSGNVTWTHGAGGFAEAGVLLVGGVELAAYTETTGGSLVFGRELTTDGLLNLLQPALDAVVGAGVLSSWSSQATVTGLNIVPGQVYEARFNISSGSGLPVNLLSSMNFGITNDEISGVSQPSAELINLLGVVTIGSGASTDNFAFQFTTDTILNSLSFTFDAASAVNLGLLGDVPGNREILSFSDFEVVPIPEPSSFALAGLAGTALLIRRKRRA